jgi:putative ABC transport system permease protein
MAMLFDVDQFHEVLQTLRRNRLRTFLTACGIFWGVFMLVVMLGFGRGLEKAAMDDIGFFAINNLSWSPDSTSKPYKGRQAGRRLRFTLDDVEAVRQVRGVEVTMGRNHLWWLSPGARVTRGDKTLESMVTGDYPEIWRTEASQIVKGRFLNDLDVTEARKVAVIGVRAQEILFAPGEDPIGKTIKVGNVAFQVVGVLDSTTASGGRRDQMQSRVFLPRSTMARAFGARDMVTSIPTLVSSERPSAEIEAEVLALLKARHHVHPDDARAIRSFNREKNFKKLNDLFTAIRTVAWVVGVLTLFAGAIGVSNIMMIAVAERTREIGIRKALGATPLSIIVQIVAEAMLLTALAGYLGLCAGVGVLELSAKIVESMPKSAQGPSFFGSPEIELGKAVFAAAVLTIAGALAGLIPARAAVAVRPVEALAHE